MIKREEAQKQIESLLLSTKRKGIENLVEALRKSDFYDAPASSKFRDNFEGGLAIHSLKVYELFNEKAKMFENDLTQDSIVICSLLHDLCKIGFYKKKEEKATTSQLNYLKDLMIANNENITDFSNFTKKYASQLIDYYVKKLKNKPIQETEWSVEETLPLGHGEKSIYLIQRYVPLTEIEACIIRWHLIAFEPGIHFGYPTGLSFKNAVEMYPIIVAFFTADYESSYLRKKNSILY